MQRMGTRGPEASMTVLNSYEIGRHLRQEALQRLKRYGAKVPSLDQAVNRFGLRLTQGIHRH